MPSSDHAFYQQWRQIKAALGRVAAWWGRFLSASLVSHFVNPLVLAFSLIFGSGQIPGFARTFSWWVLAILVVVGVFAYWFASIPAIKRSWHTYLVRSHPARYRERVQQAELSSAMRRLHYQRCQPAPAPARELILRSPKVDSWIQQGGLEIPWQELNDGFRAPEPLDGIRQDILRRHYKRGRTMFNGTLLGLLSDPDPRENAIQVQRIGYFDYLTTNMVAQDIYSSRRSDQPDIDVSEYIVDSAGRLRDISDSLLANCLGVSTLAATRDGFMILGLQGRYSNASEGSWIPSGSGSVDYADTHGAATFADIITGAAEREFFEETGVPNTMHYRRRMRRGRKATTGGGVFKLIPVGTAPIGYMRYLDRGAKPDFFCLSYVDLPAAQAIGRVRLSERGLQGRPEPFPIGSDLAEAVAHFVATRAAAGERISLQLRCTRDLLLQLRHDGRLEPMLEDLRAKAVASRRA